MENGVKAFDLDTSVIRWTILPGITGAAYAFNGKSQVRESASVKVIACE